jgi:ABC-type glycerol-3-phosphate transport system permease component
VRTLASVHSAKPRLTIGRVAGYMALVATTVVMAAPLLWMVSTALKPESQIFRFPIEWIPETPTLSNFTRVFSDYPIARWFFNSLTVAMLTTAVGVPLYALAAYPLARLNFPGKRIIFLAILATMLMPVEATMVPLFLGLSRLRLSDTYMSLVLPVVANAFGLYLLTQFFQTIPVELRDAAVIDGASHVTILWRIILPLSKPALTTVSIFTFMASWNNFVWPFIVTNTDSTRTLPAGLAALIGGVDVGTRFGISMASALIATLPPVVIFIALQRYFAQGISLTGTKG